MSTHFYDHDQNLLAVPILDHIQNHRHGCDDHSTSATCLMLVCALVA